jgi:acetyl esterase
MLTMAQIFESSSVNLPPGVGAEAEGPRLDADMRHVLEALKALGARRIEFCLPNEARAQPGLAEAVGSIVGRQNRDQSEDGITIDDIEIEGPEGPLPVRLYKPEAQTLGAPVLLFLQGGGWVISDLDRADPVPRAMAKKSGAIIASLGYRRAPEHKFPAAFEDAFSAWRWLGRQARALGGDPRRMAIMGEGVGATMALDVAARSRIGGERRPVHLVLLCPLASSDFSAPSAIENAKATPLGTPAIQWFMRQALPDRDSLADPRIDLLARTDLASLPPTTLVLAEIDPLRSGGEALGERLQEAGIDVDMTVYDGVTHGFFGLAGLVNKAMFAQAQVANRLRRAFSQGFPGLARPQ